MIDPTLIEARFAHHTLTEEQLDAQSHVRRACRLAADVINENCPDGDAKNHALGKLQAAVMWASAGIAGRQ